LAPGWKWSENVKPIAQTDSCRYVLSGAMRVYMDDEGAATRVQATSWRSRRVTMPKLSAMSLRGS
jgi:hypothetical protein